MRPNFRFLTVLLGAALLAAWGSPSDDLRLKGRLDDATRDAVIAVVEGARREGLPTEPLIVKALEGASKQAPGARIVAVVRGMVGDLKRAREALGPASNAKDVEAGAAALRAGIPVQELERLRAVRVSAQIASALDVMVILTNDGVPADTIAPRVVNLVLRGATGEQLAGLRQEIKRYINGGVAATTAAAIGGQGLEQQLIAQAANANNSGGPGSPLPSSVRGQSRGANPLATPNAVGSVQGAAKSSGTGEGAPPAGSRGKPSPKRP
jgi:hypothetical protein